MTGALRYGREALYEALGLGLFMVSAGLFGTLLEAPVSPVRQALPDPFLRRALMGLAMAATAAALIYSPWGKRSGAHLNPAVTLTFLRLGKLEPAQAAMYVAAQAAGGVLGVVLVQALVGGAFTDPPVTSVVTVPGPSGLAVAFAAEAAISFLMMATVLVVSNHERLMRLTGLAAGVLVGAFIALEGPLSGMSLNPARTLASALPSGVWTGFWLYVAAPIGGMLLAAESYRAVAGAGAVRCAKLDHPMHLHCVFRCGWCRHAAAPAASKERPPVASRA